LKSDKGGEAGRRGARSHKVTFTLDLAISCHVRG